LAYVDDSPLEAGEYVCRLLESPTETTRRIAVHTIDRRYEQLRKSVSKVLQSGLFTSGFRHELWHLLHNHYPQFSTEEKTRVWEVISGLVEEDEHGQQNDGATAYRRAIWLSALKDHGDDVAKLYLDNVRIVGGEPEHPDFSYYTSVGWVGHESPIPKEELLALEVEQLVERLDSYEDPGQFRGPGIRALAKAVHEVVKLQPNRFHKQLHKLSSLDLPYIYEVIEAYGELWTEKAQLPWEEVWGNLLRFCDDVIQQERFWDVDNAQQRGTFVANRHWIVGGIGRLIENGTKSDEHAFSEKYLEPAELVLQKLLEREHGEAFAVDGDAVSTAINSPRGRCIEALINLTLRSCRLADKKGNGHLTTWNHFQPTYDSELARADLGEYEFATLVANYLPNFLYMSKEWVFKNLDTIFDKENHQKWLCAMTGYAYVGTVYEDIYNHLKEKGHFIRALGDEDIQEKVGERIIQNIAIAYINNFETLENESSLVRQLLARGKYKELCQLIWFLWTLRKGGEEKVRTKVFELWPRLLEVVDTSSQEGRQLASRLCRWSVFLDEVNDRNRNLILAVAPFAEEDYNSHDLLESIAKISEHQPLDAYTIWRRVLDGGRPDYPEEAIRTALTNLVKAGPEGVRKAKDIVGEYLRDGNERPAQWLQEITGSAGNG